MNKKNIKKLALVVAASVLLTGTAVITAMGEGGTCEHEYHAAAISNGTVTLRCEQCKNTVQVEFMDYINTDYEPLDVVDDGIVNAKDYAYLVKNYNEFGPINGFTEEGTTDWEGPIVDFGF